jgi:hypothetical protein
MRWALARLQTAGYAQQLQVFHGSTMACSSFRTVRRREAAIGPLLKLIGDPSD